MIEPRGTAWITALGPGAPKSHYLAHTLLPALSAAFPGAAPRIALFVPENFIAQADAESPSKVSLLPVSALEDWVRTGSARIILVVEDSPESLALVQSLPVIPDIIWFLDVYRRGDAGIIGHKLFLGQAPAVVFSSERHMSEFLRVVPQADLRANAFYLPYPVECLHRLPQFPAVRRIAYCGSANLEDRPHKLLEALSSLPQFELSWLLDCSELERAQLLLQEYPGVVCSMTTGRDAESWKRLVDGSFAAVHMLVSAYGGLGPYVEISQAHGVPVLVSDFGEGALHHPLGVRLIPIGREEVAAICVTLKTLLDQSTWVGAARDAQCLVAENHRPEMLAAELSFLLARAAPMTHFQ